jgi:2,3-dihydroxyphenylpropionate 1,2-dioxygenase
VAERLISGRNPAPEVRAVRQARVFDAAVAYAAGLSDLMPLNPDWDRRFLAVLAEDLTEIDSWTNESFVQEAGHSSHGVRTWLAAHAALGTAGPYQVRSTCYEAIPGWIAGFGVTTAHARDPEPAGPQQQADPAARSPAALAGATAVRGRGHRRWGSPSR